MSAVPFGRHVALILLTLAANPAAAQTPAGIVTGVISLPAPDAQPAPVPGVTVTLTCGTADARTDVSDADGRFHFADAPTGTCTVSATLDGFKAVSKTIVVKEDATTDVAMLLEIAVLHQDVQVTGTMDGIASNPIASKIETVSSETMRKAPIATARFQDALPLIP